MKPFVFVLILLCLAATAGLIVSAPQIERLQAQSDERCFAETGYCISGRIRAFWEQNGGLPVFGYPISPQQTQEIEGQSIEVQWFERNRLELHSTDVLLGRLGAAQLEQQGVDWRTLPPATPAEDQDGCRVFETGHPVCGAFLDYYEGHGLNLDDTPGFSFEESLALFGLPLSSETPMTLSDGKQYTVQWFERARFELHPENPPESRVLLGLLGNEIRDGGSAPDSEDPVAALVDGNTAFAFDLYQLLREEDGNLFYSPYSISAALTMTYAGARGETAQQMENTLLLPQPAEGVHAAYAGLNEQLPSDSAADDDAFRLSIANALWGQQGYDFEQDFLDILDEYYDSGMQRVDFVQQPEAARGAINGWVSDQTEQRITNLIPPGAIDDMTRLVLANAIYFKADWARPFMTEMTSDAPFTLLDGSTVDVPMMSQTASFRYAEGGNYQAIALPYVGGAEMVVLLPGASTGATLTGTSWQLVEYGDPDSPQTALPDYTPTLTFEQDRLSGSTGCNIFSGDYTVDGSAFTTDSLIQTERACLEEGAMEQETDVMQLFDRADTIDLADDTLTLSGPDGVLVYTAVSSLAVFEEELTGAQVQDIIAELTPTQVALTLPKWSFESQTNLVEPLSTLGMPDAFNPSQADFSGMDGSRDISLTGVFHKAFVAVDEQGTEAAAATGVVAGVTSVQPAEPVVMRIDRPFLFLIRDRETGAVLFVGRVVNPST